MAIDPVCRMQVQEAKAAATSEYKGKKYYFCAVGCKKAFDKDPEKYLAKKAEQENYPEVARLFRAIGEAESVHAFNHLRLLGAVSGTQDNLESAFERENLAASTYPQFIGEANEEDNTSVATVLGYSRDVEKGHAKLYKKALAHMMAGEEVEYYVCQVCGYVSDGVLPDECPICGAPKEKFRKVV
jgi:rubrerythrin